MHIIVVGLGKVGQLITQYLSTEGHDVVVIDKNMHKVDSVASQFDVLGIIGNGANYDILCEAGVQKADAIITVTMSDEVNILSGMMAKKLGARYVIARVRNPDYSMQKEFLRTEMGLNMIINPEKEAAKEIRRSIVFQEVMSINTFARGRMELVELRVLETNLVGHSLNELSSLTRSKVLVCAVKRNQDVFIPDGTFTLQKEDLIFVTGSHDNLSMFCFDIGIISKKIKDVMVIGGSKIAYYLSKELLELGINVKIIEEKLESCEELADRLPGAMIIHADGSNEEIVKEEGISDCDALVCLTGMDEENIILGLMGKQLGVRKTIVKINRTPLKLIADPLPIDTVVDPKSISASQIVGYIRSKENNDIDSGLRTLYKLANDEVEALEFVVHAKTQHLHTALKNIKFKKGVLLAGIVRNGEFIFPKGDDMIEAGDSVTIVTVLPQIKKIDDIFEVNYE